jgi:hypothetical protein
MSGKKSITLYNGGSKPIHTRYRYKIPERAVYRAILLAMGGKKVIQIWDLERGKELALVTRGVKSVVLEVR